MATVRENLIAARALIDTPDKWIKGTFGFGNCYCVIGAVEKCQGIFRDFHFLPQEWKALWNALPEAHRTGELPSAGDIFCFNDEEATTHVDIMALFDRAIAEQDDANA